MENKDIKITNLPNGIDVKNVNIKYPFSGIAPNLIDKFLILGYEPKVIKNTSVERTTSCSTGWSSILIFLMLFG